jgi:hypothetical protein
MTTRTGRTVRHEGSDGRGLPESRARLSGDARAYEAFLGPSERVVGRSFTDPQETVRDVLVMTDMLARERTLSRAWSQADAGPGISEKTEAGGRQFLAIPDGAALLGAKDVTAVGFFGQLRAGMDHSILFELERKVAETFPTYARFGFLSYFDVGAEHGRYGT